MRKRIETGHPTLLSDGLYAVVRPDWAAGFVVKVATTQGALG